MAKTIFPSDIALAAQAIRDGELVAFPTETVYGLGANALDAVAVARVFAAKGRPATSPLIVHVSTIDQARTLAAQWPMDAQKLAERFWPGPLTLVVPKSALVPDAVTAGLPSVGLRMPRHPVAMALIEASGVPIAAPSANRFTELSPTRAEHVQRSFGDEVRYIVDGGPTSVGIESTVVSVAGAHSMLLRPGMISREEIEAVIGPIGVALPTHKGAHESPGQHAAHYRPRTRLLLAGADQIPKHGVGALLYLTSSGASTFPILMPGEPHAYAARLYDVLHELDVRDLDWIAVEPVPATAEWDAVRDRLSRAASLPSQDPHRPL